MQRYKIWVISQSRNELVETIVTCNTDRQAIWCAEHDPDCWAVQINGEVHLTKIGLHHMQDYVGSRCFHENHERIDMAMATATL